jgi:hypothetical protein
MSRSIIVDAPSSLILKRKTTYYVAQGRAVRRTVVLYTSLEDLITENDRRYEESVNDSGEDATLE